MIFRLCSFTIIFLVISTFAKAQEVDNEDLYSLSLEELMNITIESVSKKEETLFEAPLSSYTITHQEIIKSGITSIPEALKLCPGIIVREMTNGTYDFHIRGFDNPTQYSLTSNSVNLLTLVMINNRPIFNHNNGGTFWETLPIDINDVERIEIVRGPAAALYGPNAVTGVINIITKDLLEKGSKVWANLQHGSFNSTIANTYAGIKPSEKFDFSVSGNFQHRERTTDQYYEFFRDDFFTADEQLYSFLPYGTGFTLPVTQDSSVYIPLDELATVNTQNFYPRPELALQKYGFNSYLNYKLNDNIDFALSAGMNQVESQRAFFTNVVTMLSSIESHSTYINLETRVKNGTIRGSYLNGYENIYVGRPGMEYDYDIFDFIADYDIQIGNKLMVRPSVSMQQAAYEDLPYTNEETTGIINARQKIINYAGALRLDYRPIEKLRLIAGFRSDHFNNPNDLFNSYQFSATYLLNKKFLIRGAISSAFSGSYMGNTYSNFSYDTNLEPLGLPAILRVKYNGNKELDIFRSQLLEFGFRAKINEHFTWDLDVFSQYGENTVGFVKQAQETDADPTTGLALITVSRNVENLPTDIRMNGATLSANMGFEKLMLKPFITWQQSQLIDFARYHIAPEADPSAEKNTSVTENKTHESTPSLFGGFMLNWMPLKKLNINLNSYFFTASTQYHEQDNLVRRQEISSGINQLDGKFQLNTRIGYQINYNLDLFVTGRNIMNQDSREFYGSDIISRSFFAGLNFKL
ncbi:MAG: TonB-dependent receptor plug domain-containing protein [Cyclobacteriaceae bacterium]